LEELELKKIGIWKILIPIKSYWKLPKTLLVTGVKSETSETSIISIKVIGQIFYILYMCS
jgi:hypothetical protein